MNVIAVNYTRRGITIICVVVSSVYAYCYGGDYVHDNINTSENAVLVLRPVDIPVYEWDVILQQYNENMSNNVDIVFYGRVLDQAGGPLEGVRVAGYIRAYDEKHLENHDPGSEDQKEIDWVTTTDPRGRFVVRGISGISLHITKFEKDGYTSTDHNEEAILMSSRLYGQFASRTEEEYPMEFRMWEIGQFDQRMIKHQSISASGPADGRVYCFDLVRGSHVASMNEQHDLAIRVDSKSQALDAGPRYDWSILLSVPEGGLLATDPLYPFEAPAGEYHASVEITHSKTNRHWRRSDQRSYMLRSRTNNVHAAVDLTIYAYRDGNALIRIDAVANTNGATTIKEYPLGCADY